MTNRDGCTLLHCFAGCEFSAVIAALAARGLWQFGRGCFGSSMIGTLKRQDSRSFTRSERALRLWHAARPATATLAEVYLRSRAIILSPPPSLRFLADARHPKAVGRYPCMIAAVTREGVPGIVAVHRTYLRPDGAGKAALPEQRASLGPVKGGALRLAAASSTLLVAEGIETALAGMQASGLPAWAALSTGGLAALILPALPVAGEVMIAADNDASGAGIRAAREAAARWHKEGRTVRIALPPEIGTDFNDMLRAEVWHDR